MSKHKKPKPAPAPAPVLTQDQKDAAAINQLIGGNASGATALSNQLYSAGSLGRVSTGFQADGSRDYATQDLINRADALNKASSGIPAETQAALDQMKAGTSGYTPAEMTAMRESLARTSNTALATQLAETAKSYARQGVRGPAAQRLNQITSDQYGKNLLEGEQNLQVQSAQVKDSRLKTYADTLETAQNDKYSREADSLKNYGSVLGGVRGDELARQQFNLGQVEKEKQGAFGTYFGGLDLQLANKTEGDTSNYNDQMLAILKKQAGINK